MANTRVGLIRDYFDKPSMTEMKELSEKDKAELGSAIARERGIPANECDFELVEY